MFSIEFAIGFIILGSILRLILGEPLSFLLIIGITIGWAFAFGPWAIATFIELMIGFSVIQGLASLASKDDVK
jgi:hypothetical protein